MDMVNTLYAQPQPQPQPFTSLDVDVDSGISCIYKKQKEIKRETPTRML
jgi:hypothetical protein